MLKEPRRQRAKGNHRIKFPLSFHVWYAIQAVIRFPRTVKRYARFIHTLYKKAYVVRTIKKNIRYAEEQENERRAIALMKSMMEDL